MKFLGTLFLFAGYSLIYAAVAHGGIFATDPWSGLFADAYTDAPNVGAPTTAAPASPAPVRPRTTPPISTISGFDAAQAAYQSFLDRFAQLSGGNAGSGQVP